MIPNSDVDINNLELTEENEVDKTYKLSDINIQGFTDGLESLKQAIYKMLNTEKYEYPIYSFSYGIELESLIGKDPIYVKLELKRRIVDCLLEDDRVVSVDNFEFKRNSDNLLSSFNVNSKYGSFSMEKEVVL